MSNANGTPQAGSTPPSDPDELRREIAETREQLGDTVQALAAKVDVKAQAKRKVDDSKEQLRQKAAETKETLVTGSQRARETAVDTYREQPAAVVGAATAAVGAVVLYLIWRARR